MFSMVVQTIDLHRQFTVEIRPRQAIDFISLVSAFWKKCDAQLLEALYLSKL